jgi:hypothetical protein
MQPSTPGAKLNSEEPGDRLHGCCTARICTAHPRCDLSGGDGHGNAAYLVLNNDSYNADRHVQTGNPYEKLVTASMKQGLQIEMCGATAAADHWVNANFLPALGSTPMQWRG